MSNYGRGQPKEHSCEIIEKSVQQCQRRNLLKQKLQCMHVNFYGKSAPLMTFEGLMKRDKWMNEYDSFLISASILRMGPSYISLCKTSGPWGGVIFYPRAII